MSNPVMRGLLQAELGNPFSKVMEGIGRVAAATSEAEFLLDIIGWRLTGDLRVYEK